MVPLHCPHQALAHLCFLNTSYTIPMNSRKRQKLQKNHPTCRAAAFSDFSALGGPGAMAPDGKTAQRSRTLSNGLLAAHIIMYCLSFEGFEFVVVAVAFFRDCKGACNGPTFGEVPNSNVDSCLSKFGPPYRPQQQLYPLHSPRHGL